ncbi:type IV pilus biogenesis protein PilM [Ureibacillus aquaedulcis]|uniref:Pilus assembly protein PilM n=1 Tax=Ureibacillus aquaedulcis TaxID=3058421 RepID=A0ABT8GVS0_9BACL|nr:pilus assembly protein PilM [Ureibacillus sp. BA0131]MDN4495516.1 pilus assembly protein PilM [Ureibacillus sp. BA0131]
MFNKKKKNSHVSIEINDYVLRALVSKGPDLSQAEVFEVALPHEIIDEATLKDEMALFEIFKENANKWGGKKQNVRFFVPDPTVLLKSFEHARDVEPNKLKEFVQMELGHSIHLPFQDPLIDVYDPTEGDGQAMMFAAASEEVNKYINLFLDIHMGPQAADIRALCNLRLLESMQMIDSEKTYLIANWLINELSICIYSNGNVDFLRYQQIPTTISQWHAKPLKENELDFTYDGDSEDYRMTIMDQVLELDRIMNFFRFSLHKGEKSVDEIIVMGDNPLLDQIHNYLKETLPVTAKMVDDSQMQKYYPGFKAKHASLLGLALKEISS